MVIGKKDLMFKQTQSVSVDINSEFSINSFENNFLSICKLGRNRKYSLAKRTHVFYPERISVGDICYK